MSCRKILYHRHAKWNAALFSKMEFFSLHVGLWLVRFALFYEKDVYKLICFQSIQLEVT